MVKKTGRYDTSGLTEAQSEPGSRGRVLKNLPGIKSKREMDRIEAQEQLRTLEELSRNFPFASAKEIPRLMAEFEKGPLKINTPCRFSLQEEIVQAIAVVHTELVLIHPFREGNGRVTRILSTLMALQAGLPPLDFGGIRGKKRQEYFSAVRAGLDNNYTPMEKIFSAVIRRTLRLQPSPV